MAHRDPVLLGVGSGPDQDCRFFQLNPRNSDGGLWGAGFGLACEKPDRGQRGLYPYSPQRNHCSWGTVSPRLSGDPHSLCLFSATPSPHMVWLTYLVFGNLQCPLQLPINLASPAGHSALSLQVMEVQAHLRFWAWARNGSNWRQRTCGGWWGGSVHPKGCVLLGFIILFFRCTNNCPLIIHWKTYLSSLRWNVPSSWTNFLQTWFSLWSFNADLSTCQFLHNNRCVDYDGFTASSFLCSFKNMCQWNGYMCMYDWVPLPFNWNCHNIVH